MENALIVSPCFVSFLYPSCNTGTSKHDSLDDHHELLVSQSQSYDGDGHKGHLQNGAVHISRNTNLGS